MKQYIADRAMSIADFIIDKKSTLRAAAKYFAVSKSTAHKDVAERLPHIDFSRYLLTKDILKENFGQRHIRGGKATKEKYLQINPVKTKF